MSQVTTGKQEFAKFAKFADLFKKITLKDTTLLSIRRWMLCSLLIVCFLVTGNCTLGPPPLPSTESIHLQDHGSVRERLDVELAQETPEYSSEAMADIEASYSPEAIADMEATQESVREAGRPETPEISEPTDIQEASKEASQDAGAPETPAEGCVPGIQRACYTGPAGTAGQGPCQRGTQRCKSDGTWESCQGEVLPKKELCDNIDNDCDGLVDEDFPQQGKVCVVGVGECQQQGTYHCKGGKLGCDGTPGTPQPEICDGKDNDCDGRVDQRPCFPASQTGCQQVNGQWQCQGICRTGWQACQNGQWSDTCTQAKTPASQEFCHDQQDNDCDGQIDEDCCFPDQRIVHHTWYHSGRSNGAGLLPHTNGRDFLFLESFFLMNKGIQIFEARYASPKVSYLSRSIYYPKLYRFIANPYPALDTTGETLAMPALDDNHLNKSKGVRILIIRYKDGKILRELPWYVQSHPAPQYAGYRPIWPSLMAYAPNGSYVAVTYINTLMGNKMYLFERFLLCCGGCRMENHLFCHSH